MRVPGGLRFCGLVLVGLLGLAMAAGTAVAQRRGGGGGMPGGHGGGIPSGRWPGSYPGSPSSPGNPSSRGGTPSNGSGDQTSNARGGLQLGPPGRWWDDKHFAKSLKLRPEQQRRMDGIFEQSRASLLHSYETLQQEQQRLDALSHARPLDESALDAQIDRVAQARADLQKANTHLLYQIRGEMDPDQIARLEDPH